MSSHISQAPTLTPGDSASQVATPVPDPPKPSRGRPKRPSKAAVDKDAPQGAVQVPGAKVASGPSSKVVSGTIPLSGWGNIDLTSHRRDIEPTFTTDARPFADMVDTTYQSIQSRFSTGGKHIPRSLFRYYCTTLWWLRSIWLHKSNGNVLNSDQKDFLNVISNMEDLQVPAHIAQYLANMGNFTQGNEQFFFRLMDNKFTSIDGATAVQKGWLLTSDANNRVTDDTMWTYSQVPVPGVMTTAICNEANAALPAPGNGHTLDHIYPLNSGHTVYATENIIGWDTTPLTPAHSSWRATFSQLGFGAHALPPDMQTAFNVSTSTLKWVSDRLSTVKDFKVHSIKQLTLSTQGHSMQAYYLSTDSPPDNMSQFPVVAEYQNNRINGSRNTTLALKSRFAMDAKILAPAFAFGYRLERTKHFRDYHEGQPRAYSQSNYQPWILMNAAGTTAVGYTAAQFANMNSTFSFGSQAFINVPRFSTHGLNRSVGLDAALILSDVK